MTTAIEDRLKKLDIQVELRDKGLAFIPGSKLDDDLREVLETEGKGLYRMAREISERLQLLGERADSDPEGWKAVHKRIMSNWPWDYQAHNHAYSHLVSWVGALLMRTTALNALGPNRKRPLTGAQRLGRMADISFTDRLIPITQRRLINTCILWPDIRGTIMRMKIT